LSEQVVVIGAGPAGVSVALSLKDRGVCPLLVDRADQIASSWRSCYDRLKLNTGRQFSHLPNRKYPKGTPVFPTRDQVVAHIEGHAREGGIDIRLSTPVDRIDRRDGRWRLLSGTGDIDSRYVVVATGYEHTPLIPDWPGRDGFTGALLHSSAYRNPFPFKGKRVLVVGPGSSGMEIAHDLATGGAAKVWLSVRTPPNIMLRQGPAGLPGDVIAGPLYHAPPRIADAIAKAARKANIGDLSEFGLPIPQEGPFTRSHRLNVAPSLVDIEVIDAIRDRSIEVVAAVSSFRGESVTLADGIAVEPDTVIAATGYRRGLEPLVGHLGVLDADGVPRAGGTAPAADGLWFFGLISRPSLIGYLGKQSKPLAKRIAAELSS
jgi:NADPH-dependent 2,4-dienoyl-CoA reductase/sulfur reductase-like enzyme